MTKVKKMAIANFNITFGENEEPLLNYFDTILLPALKSNLVRSIGGTDYLFFNVDVIEIEDEEYAIKGIIIKKTNLEVFSKFDDNSSTLFETNELHPTAPYSTFVIYLKNHRMVLVKNQKGSPDLRSFAATITYVLDRYIRDENIKRKEQKEPLLPYSIVNVVGIPLRENINEAIKNVSKINKLILKFYPLNGDIDFSGMFNTLTTDLRKAVGSKTGSTTLNSPKSVSGITEILEQAQGTVEPVFKVTYPDKKKGTITNGQLSENMEINLLDNNINEDTKEIIERTKGIDSIKYISQGNEEIYNKNKYKIVPFVRKEK